MHPYYPQPPPSSSLQHGGHNAYHSSASGSPSSYSGNPAQHPQPPPPGMTSQSPYARHLLQHPPPPHHLQHHHHASSPTSMYARSGSGAASSSSSGHQQPLPPPPLHSRQHSSPHNVKPYGSPPRSGGGREHARRLSYSDDTSPPPAMSEAAAAPPPAKRPRTARACLRCRSQKLKCSGEIPCQRCTRLQVTCRDAASASAGAKAPAGKEDSELSRGRDAYDGERSVSTTERQLYSALRRIAHLEASVESINYRLSTAPVAPDAHAGNEGSGAVDGATPALPPPSVSQFPAPFTDVAYDKKMVENRQDTRANTPIDEEDRSASRPSTSRAEGGATGLLGMAKASAAPRPTKETDEHPPRTVSRRKMGTLGSPSDPLLDPITEHIISAERANELVDFFFKTCHPYVPLFDTRKLPRLEHMRRNEVFLLCAILAIAARYGEMTSATHTPEQAEMEREDLCQVAEAHMGRTLVVPRHRLGDVQAIVLLHAYSLRSGGSGHDAWVLSGHAFRLAKRLSIDRIVTTQPDTHKISGATSMLRRTWLLLCASDCFPSLGFGRPASPRENLDSCAPILNLLAERYAQREAAAADEEDELDDAEFFIASQVELASISRRLLDWVAQTKLPLTRSSDLRAVAHKYDMLVDQLDTCQVRWNGRELATAEQSFTSRLFRLHVRLCLATFTVRLSETALQNGSSKRRHAEAEAAGEEKAAGVTDTLRRRESRNSGGVDLIAADRTREISDRLQVDCRKACLNAATEMCSVHKLKALTYVPDYLITALAQAIITSIGVLETQTRLAHIKRTEATARAQAFVDDARQILSTFTSNQTGLANFLLDKVVERGRRSTLLESKPTERLVAAVNDRLAPSYERTSSRSPAAVIDGESNQGMGTMASVMPAADSLLTSDDQQQALFGQRAAPDYAQQHQQQALYGSMAATGSTPFGSEMDLLLNGAGGFVPPGGLVHSQVFASGNAGGGGADNDAAAALQWGGLPQWWNGDDPLQLLFGIGTGDGTWPRAMSTATSAADDRASVLNNGSEASPNIAAGIGAGSDTTSPLSHVNTSTPSGGGGGGSVTFAWQRGRGATGE